MSTQIQTQIDTGTLRNYLEAKLPEALDVLREMVGINSFTWNASGVNRVGDLTAQLFEPLGFTVERREPVLHRPDISSLSKGRHVFLTRPGRSSRKVGLVGHLDTVYTEEEEQANDFRWRVCGERIYGPGVIDIKGGNVQIWLVLSALREAAPALFDAVTWVVMFDAGEEELMTDFGQLERQYLGEDALANLVFESVTLEGEMYRLVSHRKGRARVRAVARGRSAHAGTYHQRGANALVEMSRFVDRISRVTDYERDLTCNVGVVQGGVVPNRVPDYAEALIELRAFEQAVLDEAIAEVTALDGMSTVTSPVDGFAARMEVECVQRLQPWPQNAGSDGLVDLWREASELLGLKVVAGGRGGLSDGNFTHDLVPTLDGLGPAGGNAHCAIRTDDGSADQEYLLPSTIVPCAMLATLGIERLIHAAGLAAVSRS